MKNKCFVGFDTSNYTTSAAVCDMSGTVTANLKIPLPVKDGERGLRQSDALFGHIKNLPELTDALRAATSDFEVAAVGVSARPRSVSGSYMPCFLTGISASHAFAAAANTDVYEFSHQDGHVMAALYSSGQADKLIGREFAAFHVSGGTTEILLAHPLDGLFSLSLVGGTDDLNAGQVIDRVGVAMGLSFPCGAELERLACGYTGKFPRPSVAVRGMSCNLSGVENMAKKLYDETSDPAAVAAFVFDYLGRTLSSLAGNLIAEYGKMPILFAGGVMSNGIMRKMLSEKNEAYFAEPRFSADNAAGVALLCRRRCLAQRGELR